MKSILKITLLFILPIFAIFTFTGCSQTSSMLVEPGHSFNAKSFKVNEVKDITKDESEVDKITLLKNAVIQELKDKGLYSDNGENIIELNMTITKYAEGNAFKRWLMPGWGGTKLTVETKLIENEKNVATSVVEHTVTAGGGYTIGAHEYIFKDVAKNIVEDILKKM